MYPLLAIRRNAGLRQFYIGFTFRLRSLIDGYFITHFLFYSIVYILMSHVALSISSRCHFCHPFSVCTPSCVFRPVFFPQSLSFCLLPHISFASSFLFPIFLCCSFCFQPLCSQWFVCLVVFVFVFVPFFGFAPVCLCQFYCLPFGFIWIAASFNNNCLLFCHVLALSVFSPIFPKHNPVSV